MDGIDFDLELERYLKPENFSAESDGPSSECFYCAESPTDSWRIYTDNGDRLVDVCADHYGILAEGAL